MVVLTVKYRLYPTALQNTALQGMLAVACDVYNSLVHCYRYDQVHGTSPTYCEQS